MALIYKGDPIQSRPRSSRNFRRIYLLSLLNLRSPTRSTVCAVRAVRAVVWRLQLNGCFSFAFQLLLGNTFSSFYNRIILKIRVYVYCYPENSRCIGLLWLLFISMPARNPRETAVTSELRDGPMQNSSMYARPSDNCRALRAVIIQTIQVI